MMLVAVMTSMRVTPRDFRRERARSMAVLL
jgi:hypothetical protein